MQDALRDEFEDDEAFEESDWLADFENDCLIHDKLDRAMQAMDGLRSRYRPPGQRPLKARAMLLVGASGSGKTSAIEHYASGPQNAPRSTPLGNVRPVVTVEVVHKSTRRMFVESILNELGYESNREANVADIVKRLSKLLRKMRVELLIFDEAHHILDARAKPGEQDISEFIKSLLNKCKTQIVLSGLPTLLSLHKYKQLDRRLLSAVVLTPYNWTFADERGSFLACLNEFEYRAGLPAPSNLGGDDIAMRIYCASGGHIGLVSKLLSEALQIARSRNAARITPEILAEVFAGPDSNPVVKVTEDPFAPAVLAARQMDRATNPFLAGREDFLALWKKMVVERDEMIGRLESATLTKSKGKPGRRTVLRGA